MTLFLALTYWTILNENKVLFWIFFLLTLGFKETLFVLGIGLSIFIFIIKPKWRLTSILVFLLFNLWFFNY